MHVTLLMAITINGFVAGPDDDTEWVRDIDATPQGVLKLVEQKGLDHALIIGGGARERIISQSRTH